MSIVLSSSNAYNITKYKRRAVISLARFIPRKPDEKEVISIRLSSETLKQIDEQASTFDISRNELINQMICFALTNMADTTV